MALPIALLLTVYTISASLPPYSAYSYPVDVPAGYVATITPHLPPICNSTGPLTVLGPATISYICYNNSPNTTTISGYIDLELTEVGIERTQRGAGANPLAVIAAIGAAIAIAVALMVRPPGGLGPRLKSLALEEQIRHSIIDYLNKVGAATLAQITAQLRQEEGLIRWHLYVLEREGRIRSVRVGPYIFYFTKAKKAAEVILASLDPSLVPPEDRALLDLWASS